MEHKFFEQKGNMVQGGMFDQELPDLEGIK